jgi:hypothetical protein
MSKSIEANGGVDPWPHKDKAAAWRKGGGSDPWPYNLGIEEAGKQFTEGLVGMKLRVFTPDSAVGITDYVPDRINITVDADARITSVKFG